MFSVILTIHVLVSIVLIGFILIQHGKGAEAGAAFSGGGGASSTVFGAQGSGSFLTRATAILATTFFITSLLLAAIPTGEEKPQALMEGVSTEVIDTQSDESVPMDGATESEVPMVMESSDDESIPVQEEKVKETNTNNN